MHPTRTGCEYCSFTLSPCILPVLLQGSTDTGRWKPVGIIVGFAVSFIVFALIPSTLANALGVPANLLRHISVSVLAVLAFVTLIPGLMTRVERLVGHVSSRATVQPRGQGLSGGLLIGIGLGVVWTPCVGTIMVSVIALSLTSAITWQAVVVTIVFTAGTAIPMVIIMYGGREILTRVVVLKRNGLKTQRIFAGLMLVAAVVIGLGLDRRFHGFVLDVFPNHGNAVISVESNSQVEAALPLLQGDEHLRMPGNP